MKRFHLSISVQDFAAALSDYSQRLACAPCIVKDGRFALWRTDILNFSISCKPQQQPGIVRHLGFEDNAVHHVREEVDCVGITWEYFSQAAQEREIEEKFSGGYQAQQRAQCAPVTFRLLGEQDNEMFRVLRLRACKEEPSAFLEAYEDLVELPLEHFARYLERGWIAGAFAGDTLVGIAGLHRHKGRRIEHKGTVWGVYIVPEHRGCGYSKQLLALVMDQARMAGLEMLMLSTDASNAATIRLYQGLGFIPYGIEKQTLKLEGGRYVDDLWMMKMLTENAPTQ